MSETPFGRCKVVLLAGGYGTRLAERTDTVPKPMVEIGGRPVLWHIMKLYGHFGFNDFVVACGYKSEVVKRFFLEYRDRHSDLLIDYANDCVEHQGGRVEPWRVALVETGTDTQTGGRLKRLTRYIDTADWLMTYGDGLANLDLAALYRFHLSHGRLATFTTIRAPSQFGHLELDGDRVISFQEKALDPDNWINGGFFALKRGVLDWIEGDDTSFEVKVLPRLAKEGELMAFRHDGFWKPMDTLRDVRTLNQAWQDGAPWKVWAG